MDFKTWKNIIIYLSINFFFITNSLKSLACAEFWPDEYMRIVLFRAEVPQIQRLQEFYYTQELYNHAYYNNNNYDRNLNIQEWQTALGPSIATSDIEFVLYKTDPDFFIRSYENNSLMEDFSGNTFIRHLSEKKNIEYLAYLKLAKQIEFLNFLRTSDPWNNQEYNYDNFSNKYDTSFIIQCRNKIEQSSNEFLKMRYAYQYIRITNSAEAIETYERYFEKNPTKSIIKVWALFFKAIALDRSNKHSEASYLYSRVFELSDEKKHYCYNAMAKDADSIGAVMQFAKTATEKGNILALSILNYPGRCMDKLEKIFNMSPNNDFLYILIMREINKVEDWLYSENESKYFESKYEIDKWLKKQKINKHHDSLYLMQFHHFLISCYHSKNSINKDFLAVAIAHLYFLNKDNSNGLAFLNKISGNANKAILKQVHIDMLLFLINKGNLDNKKNKHEIAKQLLYLEGFARESFYYYKSIFSITKKLSSLYKNKHIVLYGLFKLKSDLYLEKYDALKNDHCIYFPEDNYLYDKIRYFDNTASIKDMDEILGLIRKKKKSVFEKYICENTIGNENIYKDLKGTIAFRSSDLKLAYKTFVEIPDSFWQEYGSYKRYLNENPFIPKCLTKKRNFSYPFNKTIFVKQLIDLIEEAKQNPQKSAENYLKLGHAFYNCSYYGNSWMMMSYNQYISDGSGYGDYEYFNNSQVNSNKSYSNNFYNNTTAIKYYKSAISATNNNELKAEAYYMLAECNGKYLAKYIKYQNTLFFRNTFCAVANDFIKNNRKKRIE
jgi:hypothetical protein